MMPVDRTHLPRRCSLLGVTVLVALQLVPSDAVAHPHREDLEFATSAPCAVACPYYVGESTGVGDPYESVCEKTPQTVPGSWADIRVSIPTDIHGEPVGRLLFTITPEVFYDGFICRVIDPGSAEERYEFAARTTVQDLCDFPCPQRTSIAVESGQVLVLRVFNFLDGPICRGYYLLTS